MLLKLLILIFILYVINFLISKREILKNNKQTNYIEIHKERIKNYKDISKILFIPEIKYYNPEAYNDCVEYIDAFLENYEIIKIDASKASYLYDNMIDNKKYILNSLMSLSIRIPDEYNLRDVIRDMENILDDYLYEVYKIYKEYIEINGYDYTTKLIYNMSQPDAYNLDDNIVEPGKKLLFNRI
jgi:hypothetical protein